MLADDILASGHQSAFHRQILERVKAPIKGAGRFTLERDAVAAAQLVTESMPSSIVTGLPLCRLPYPTTWLEYAGSDRVGRSPAGTMLPQRVGLLCESTRGSNDEFTVHVFWRSGGRDGGVELSPVALRLDMSAARHSRLQPDWAQQKHSATLDGLRRELAATHQLQAQLVAANKSELEAALELSNRVLFVKSRYFTPIESAIVANAGEAAFENLMQMSRENSKAEAGLLLAALMLLNTRNGTTRQLVDLSKLNASRRKRGAEPLLNHWTVTLRLGAGRARGLAQLGMRENEMRAHLVRGHFKIRKTGLFWWSPYIRGDAAQGMVQKEYRIRA